MTPADLKIRREALGLPQDWVAREFGVQSRSVRRWEGGESEIPYELQWFFDRLENERDEYVNRILTTIDEIVAENGAPAVIELSAFATTESLWLVHPEFEPMPARWYRAVLARVRESVDIPVVFHFPAIE